jgi:exonuclease III
MRVLIWNVLAERWIKEHHLVHGLDVREDERTDKIIDTIKNCDADVICLQEVELETVGERLIRAFPEYEYAIHTLKVKTNGIGNLTLSKFKVVSVVLAQSGVHCILDDRLWVSNVHFKAGKTSFARRRLCEAESCFARYSKSGLKRAIVCGDFNDNLISEDNKAVHLFRARGFAVYPTGSGCFVGGEFLPCDGCIAKLPRNMAVISESILSPDDDDDYRPIPNDVIPSDHYPVVFEFVEF